MKIGFEIEPFVSDLAREITTPGVRPVDATERLLSQHLTASLKAALGTRAIKEPTVRIHAGYSKNRWAVLPELAAGGYETWYPDLRFSTKLSDMVDVIEIEPTGFMLDPIDYGFGVSRTHDFKIKTLKTQRNHILRLNRLKIAGFVFDRVLKVVAQDRTLEQPYLANPAPALKESGNEMVVARDEFVSFDHIVDGSRVFCDCAKPAHDKARSSAMAIAHQYVADSWPHQLIRFLSAPVYSEAICHLCVARSMGPEGAAYRYGDAMQEFVAPYINQLVQSQDMDERTARAEVQRTLGLSRWLREAEMYQSIKQIFPDALVLREASPPWLGRQRLDVFLPQLCLALEYQGEQHYLPIAAFGGAEALARTVERDALKKRLCHENSVELVCIRFDESLTTSSLRHRLRRFLYAAQRPGV